MFRWVRGMFNEQRDSLLSFYCALTQSASLFSFSFLRIRRLKSSKLNLNHFPILPRSKFFVEYLRKQDKNIEK